MMSHLVIIPLLLPLLTGILLLLLRGSATELQRLINLAATLGLVAVALLLLMQTGEGQVEVYRLGNWSAPFGIVLAADRLAAVMVLVTGLLATGVLLHGRRVGSYFHVLFQMQLFGLNGAFLTGDLFNLFVFFEVLLIASYGLLLLGGGRNRTRAGLHYVVLNLVGSTLFLFAVGSLYGVLGTLNMADMAVRLARRYIQQGQWSLADEVLERGSEWLKGSAVLVTPTGQHERRRTVDHAIGAHAPGEFLVLPEMTRLRRVAIRPRQTRVYSGTIPARQGGPGVELGRAARAARALATRAPDPCHHYPPLSVP